MNIDRIASAKLDGSGGYIIVLVGGQKMTSPNDPKNAEYRFVQRWIAAGNTPEPSDEDSMSLADYKTRAKDNQKQKGKQLFVNYKDEIDTSDADASTYKTNLNNYFISNVKAPIDAAVDKAGVDAAVNAVDWSSVVVP